jgi:hypothetical protein
MVNERGILEEIKPSPRRPPENYLTSVHIERGASSKGETIYFTRGMLDDGRMVELATPRGQDVGFTFTNEANNEMLDMVQARLELRDMMHQSYSVIMHDVEWKLNADGEPVQK